MVFPSRTAFPAPVPKPAPGPELPARRQKRGDRLFGDSRGEVNFSYLLLAAGVALGVLFALAQLTASKESALHTLACQLTAKVSGSSAEGCGATNPAALGHPASAQHSLANGSTITDAEPHIERVTSGLAERPACSDRSCLNVVEWEEQQQRSGGFALPPSVIENLTAGLPELPGAPGDDEGVELAFSGSPAEIARLTGAPPPAEVVTRVLPNGSVVVQPGTALKAQPLTPPQVTTPWTVGGAARAFGRGLALGVGLMLFERAITTPFERVDFMERGDFDHFRLGKVDDGAAGEGWVFVREDGAPSRGINNGGFGPIITGEVLLSTGQVVKYDADISAGRVEVPAWALHEGVPASVLAKAAGGDLQPTPSMVELFDPASHSTGPPLQVEVTPGGGVIVRDAEGRVLGMALPAEEWAAIGSTPASFEVAPLTHRHPLVASSNDRIPRGGPERDRRPGDTLEEEEEAPPEAAGLPWLEDPAKLLRGNSEWNVLRNSWGNATLRRERAGSGKTDTVTITETKGGEVTLTSKNRAAVLDLLLEFAESDLAALEHGPSAWWFEDPGPEAVAISDALRNAGFEPLGVDRFGGLGFALEPTTWVSQLRAHFERHPDNVQRIRRAMERETPLGRDLQTLGFYFDGTELRIPSRERVEAGLDAVGPQIFQLVTLATDRRGTRHELPLSLQLPMGMVPVDPFLQDGKFVDMFSRSTLPNAVWGHTPHIERSGVLHDLLHELASRRYPTLTADIVNHLAAARDGDPRYARLRSGDIFNLLENAIRVQPETNAILTDWLVALADRRGEAIALEPVMVMLADLDDAALTRLAGTVAATVPDLIEPFGAVAADEIAPELFMRFDLQLDELLHPRPGGEPGTKEQIRRMLAATLAELHNWAQLPDDAFVDAYFGLNEDDQDLLHAVTRANSRLRP